MNIINLDVYKNTVKKRDGFNPVSVEHNYTKLKFNFTKGDDWGKCRFVTASFFQSIDNIVKSDIALVDGDLTAVFSIPGEFIGAKDYLYVGLQGTYTDETEEIVTISTNIVKLNLNKGALVKEEISQSIFEKIMQLLNQIFDSQPTNELKNKEDTANKIANFDTTFTDETGKKYPTVLAIMNYLNDYYYNHQETYNQEEIDNLLKNLSGVYIGEEKPTDPNIYVWIKPDGEENVIDVSEVGM